MGKQMDTLTDDHLLDDLNVIANSSDGAIQITVAKPEIAKTSLRIDKEPELLTCRRQTRAIETDRQVSSFSALTSKTIKQTPVEKEDRDHDAILPTPPETAADEGVVNGERVTLSDFESGPLPGICIHEIYEELDFASNDRDSLQELVESKLRRYGFQSDTWQNVVCGGIEESLDTELDLQVPGLALKQITNARRLNELEFTFPIANRPDTLVSPLTGERLKTCFSKYGDRALLGPYPGRLGQLDFQPLTGYLKGFIDLIFEYDGRYYIVDYKTNHLGNFRTDYGTEQLGKEMAHHHYFLQYHLYTVALHRYLAYRLDGYDYDRHFGAVYYLFVRGMSPNTGPDYGVFKDRPDKKLIEALSSLMEGGRAK
jgi:exodeoxyribonuclease V beta subunit